MPVPGATCVHARMLGGVAVMPSFATLFDKKCKPVFDFGTGPRNIARWSPQGDCILPLLPISPPTPPRSSSFTCCPSVLCLAGFGNLPGDVVRAAPPPLQLS